MPESFHPNAPTQRDGARIVGRVQALPARRVGTSAQRLDALEAHLADLEERMARFTDAGDW